MEEAGTDTDAGRAQLDEYRVSNLVVYWVGLS